MKCVNKGVDTAEVFNSQLSSDVGCSALVRNSLAVSAFGGERFGEGGQMLLSRVSPKCNRSSISRVRW